MKILKNENLPLLFKSKNISILFSRLAQFSIFWSAISLQEIYKVAK